MVRDVLMNVGALNLSLITEETRSLLVYPNGPVFTKFWARIMHNDFI